MPNPATPERAPDDVRARLPIATRVAPASPAAPAEVAWAFAPVADGIADAVAAAFGVRLRSADEAPSPLDHPAFAALYASARAEQIIREVSSRTNLVLAGTTAVIDGDGPVAAQLTTALARVGVRVVRTGIEPLAALRARLAGLDTAPGAAGAHYTFVTGEGRVSAVRAADLAGVVVDVSPTRTALRLSPEAAPAMRAGVRLDGAAQVVGVDGPLPRDRSTGGPAWRTLDALVALSILVARGGPGDADDALARAALAALDGERVPA